MITQPGQVPSGWGSGFDPTTGCVFYIDHNNKTTQWEHPNPAPLTQDDAAEVVATTNRQALTHQLNAIQVDTTATATTTTELTTTEVSNTNTAPSSAPRGTKPSNSKKRKEIFTYDDSDTDSEVDQLNNSNNNISNDIVVHAPFRCKMEEDDEDDGIIDNGMQADDGEFVPHDCIPGDDIGDHLLDSEKCTECTTNLGHINHNKVKNHNGRHLKRRAMKRRSMSRDERGQPIEPKRVKLTDTRYQQLESKIEDLVNRVSVLEGRQQGQECSYDGMRSSPNTVTADHRITSSTTSSITHAVEFNLMTARWL